MMAEKASAEDFTKDKEVSDGEMASRLSKNMAKKFATKRDSTGQSTINKSLATATSETSNLLAQTSSFLAQVRSETDQAKKSKPTFLKPADD